MPNHVFQTATLTIADPDVRATIVGLAEKGESIIKHYFPLPADASKLVTTNDGTTFSAFSDTGHNTAIELWGTKWADYDVALQDVVDNCVTVSFSSAWGPADIGLARVADLLDIHITLEWQEEQPSDIGAAIIDGKKGVVWSLQYYGDKLDEALARLGATPYPEQDDIDAIDPETAMSPLDTYYENSSDAVSAVRDELYNEMEKHLSLPLSA